MIHQCYFEEAQRSRLFASPLYQSFGLYSSVNPDIARNCPELADPKHQPLLSEYAAMLHLWRNPELDGDRWIGFTSYRQLEKFPTVLTDRANLEAVLSQNDIVGWGFYQFFDADTRQPISLAEQGERCHPGITSSLWRLMLRGGVTFPNHYLHANEGLYCNYWAMSKRLFDDFMNWSCPLVQWALREPDAFVRSHPRSLSYVIERLFICWYALTEKKRVNIGKTTPILTSNPWREAVPSNPSTRRDQTILPGSWNASLDEICPRHQIAPRGIIHVGAHHGEERDAYRRLGIREVIWIEADPQHLSPLQAHVAYDLGHRVIGACLSDADGPAAPFYRTNNRGESSSLLPLGTHRRHFRNIEVVGEIPLETVKFATLARKHQLTLDDFDFLVLDVQGAELMVLRGFGDQLERFTGIYLEVNVEDLYQGCALLADIDAYLQRFGLVRRETLLTDKCYGDALYLRADSPSASPIDLAQLQQSQRAQLVATRTFVRHSGTKQVNIELLADGSIGGSAESQRQMWGLRLAGHELLLEFFDKAGRTAWFRQLPDGTWRGRRCPYSADALKLTAAVPARVVTAA